MIHDIVLATAWVADYRVVACTGAHILIGLQNHTAWLEWAEWVVGNSVLHTVVRLAPLTLRPHKVVLAVLDKHKRTFDILARGNLLENLAILERNEAGKVVVELADIAVQIQELWAHYSPDADSRLTPDIYETLKKSYPVLAELEQRPDAVEFLNAYYIYHNVCASVLQDYYIEYHNYDAPGAPSSHLANQWTLVQNAYTAIYEHTEAPTVSFTYIYGGTDAGPCTVFDFGGVAYTLKGQKTWSENNPNFWFRVELKRNIDLILAAEPEPKLTYDAANGTWVEIQPYDSGWFVYGYAGSSLLHGLSLVAASRGRLLVAVCRLGAVASLIMKQGL